MTHRKHVRRSPGPEAGEQCHEQTTYIPAGRTSARRTGPAAARLQPARPLLRPQNRRIPAPSQHPRRGTPGQPGTGGPGRGMRDRAVLRPAAGKSRPAGPCRRHRGITRDGRGRARAHRSRRLAQRHGRAVTGRGRQDPGHRGRRPVLRRARHLAVPRRAAEHHAGSVPAPGSPPAAANGPRGP